MFDITSKRGRHSVKYGLLRFLKNNRNEGSVSFIKKGWNSSYKWCL